MSKKPQIVSARGEFNLNAFRDEFMGLIREQRHEEASEMVESLAQEHPGVAPLRYEAGFHFSKMANRLDSYGDREGDTEAARKKAFMHFRAASDLIPTKYPYAFRAGMAGRKLGSREALTYIYRAIALDQSSSHPWTELGLYHARFQRREIAATCFKNAVRLDANDEFAQRLLLETTRLRTVQGPVDFSPLRFKI